jgi:peptidoglycan/xylan/chitin deacetylase (PgdA/CDA1 family)
VRLVRLDTSRFSASSPASSTGNWGESIPGVKTRLATSAPVVALTLDACGSENDSLDWKLITFLCQQHIPATLFLAGRWMGKFPQAAQWLARHPLFDIQNHGQNHKPASVSGQSVYGIQGTTSPQDLAREVFQNAWKIFSLTGRWPRFFRPGTAYWDAPAVNWVRSWGMQPLGFSILGDAGASYSAKQVHDAVSKASAGDIIIAHMNHPEKQTAQGLMSALPGLRQKGYQFVKLSDVS